VHQTFATLLSGYVQTRWKLVASGVRNIFENLLKLIEATPLTASKTTSKNLKWPEWICRKFQKYLLEALRS